MKRARIRRRIGKLNVPAKYLQGLLNGFAALFFPRGADASVGGEEYSGYAVNSTMAGFAVSGYALRAHQTRTMKIGDITRGEAGFARHFRFSSMAKYSFRKKRLDPRLARDCDCARAMECGSCARRVHMRRPEGFLRRRLRYLRDSGLGNVLQISPPPLQRSFNGVIIPLQNLRFAEARLYFFRTDASGVHIELWARYVPSPEKPRAPKKNRLSAQNEMRAAAARNRAFWLSANPEIPRGGRAGFRGARTGAGAG